MDNFKKLQVKKIGTCKAKNCFFEGNLPIQVPQMRPPIVAVNAAKHCGHNNTFEKLIF